METDFDKTMSDIEQTMTGTVEKMEMADEAKEAAQATIKAYCDAIRSMTGEAGSAAEAVANAAASHLKTTPTTPQRQLPVTRTALCPRGRTSISPVRRAPSLSSARVGPRCSPRRRPKESSQP